MAYRYRLADLWKAIFLLAVVLILGVLVNAQGGPNGGLWVSDQEIAQLPSSGPAWDRLVSAANDFRANPSIRIVDQDDKGDSLALACAMVWKKTGDVTYLAALESGLAGVIGTEDDDFPGENNTSLELSRNVCCVVLAADLVGYREPSFVAWVDMIRTYEREDGRSITSTHEDRPNNWGTHAGASRLAASGFVRDWEDVRQAARLYLGWLGCRGLYSSFEFSDPLCWHTDPDKPVGINPPASVVAGLVVDGVLPDDQRRSGRCPPDVSQENYVYEALQGALTQAILLDRLGLEGVWLVKQKALLRANRWLLDVAHFPAEGDDQWQPFVIRKVYKLDDTEMSLPAAAGFGKSVGFTDWLVQSPTWP